MLVGQSNENCRSATYHSTTMIQACNAEKQYPNRCTCGNGKCTKSKRLKFCFTCTTSFFFFFTTSVALIGKVGKSPVSITIEATMPHQWPWRISSLLWHCIIIKQWALSWRGWTQINYLFLYTGDDLLKCHASQLQGWDELYDSLVQSAASMMLLLHLQALLLLQKRWAAKCLLLNRWQCSEGRAC